MPDAERDRDLQSIHEARVLGRAAMAAQRQIEGFSQEQVDAVVEAMAAAGLQHSARLAELAHRETGYGNVPDKVRKNDFVLRDVVAALRGMRTVGVLREDREHGVREIAEPVGVVAGIIPSTNPTSTAMFKCLIAVKARCGIVLSPHPSAAHCVQESAAVMAAAAREAGAPQDLITCMTNVTMQGTKELMNGRETDLILATGGTALVRAAYSAGKPAYGVGPGNVPAYIESSADVAKAVRDILAGTTFDNGTLCSSEQAIVCDRAIRDEVMAQVRAQGGHFLSPEECAGLAAVLITRELLVNPAYVGRPASTIAAAAGISVPDGTRVLVAPQEGVGKQHPLSHEKLSPVLAFYVVQDWQEGCTRCTELLRFGGMGHTMAIHSRNDDVVLQFGLRKPAHRVLVNTVAALGAIGLTTHLFPSMTLGCGSWGNNITSDNIGPQHLINVKRLAYETREFHAGESDCFPVGGSLSFYGSMAPSMGGLAIDQHVEESDCFPVAGSPSFGGPTAPSMGGRTIDQHVEESDCLPVGGSPSFGGSMAPSMGGMTIDRYVDVAASTGGAGAAQHRDGAKPTPEVPGSEGDVAGAGASLESRVAGFLGKRGLLRRDPSAPPAAGRASVVPVRDASAPARPAPDPPRGRAAARSASAHAPLRAPQEAAAQPSEEPFDFVCEDDVREALKRGGKIRIGPDTIVTPLARELGEARGVFRRH